jgi:hypothetical protein
MYHILNFYANFLKFIVHTMNSEMVKYEIVKLTEREKTGMTDVEVVVG